MFFGSVRDQCTADKDQTAETGVLIELGDNMCSVP